MRYTIEAIENAENGMSWEEIGVNGRLGQAYLCSKAAGNELPDFGDAVWDEDIEAILSDCRRLGVKEFTVSSTFSGVVGTIAKLVEMGCSLDGIVKVRARYASFGSEERELIPAFKITVG